MSVFAGVDIGGTFTKVGVRGEKFCSVRFETPHDKEALNKRIAYEINLLSPHIDGVGIAVPGAVVSGCARFLPNLDIAPFDGHELSKVLCAPTLIVNDGNAAAYGESKESGCDNIVLISLGTGVGGGIVIDGKPYDGAGGAGEIGHMVISAGGRKCGCGLRGCLEAYASATALVTSYKQRTGKDVKGAKEVFELSDKGDEAAQNAVKELLDFLSIGIINLCNIFRPQAIIIGGGVANRSDLIDGVRDRCEKFDYGYKFAPVPLILRAKLKDDAGVIGAIELIKNKVEEGT